MSNIDDIVNWHKYALPMAAEWNRTGYSLAYHVQKVQDGHHFLPSVDLPIYSADEAIVAEKQKYVDSRLVLSADQWAFLNNNRIPLCLRTNNISGAFTSLPYRLPKDLENIPSSPLVWRYKSDGTLEDSGIADYFGSVACWQHEGDVWGKCLYMKVLQDKHKTPAYIIFLENNEGPDDNLKLYANKGSWFPPETLKTLSLRIMDYIAANPAVTFGDFSVVANNLLKEKYNTLYNAFKAGWVWKTKMYRACYKDISFAGSSVDPKYFPQLGYSGAMNYRDAGSPSVYVTKGAYSDFTSPEHFDIWNAIPIWQEQARRNPDAFREISHNISDDGTFRGAKDGIHELMTPARYQAYIEWMLWSIRDVGSPVIMRRWCGSTETPSTPLYDLTQTGAILDSLGATAEQKKATSESYLLPIINACDKICNNVTYRMFWQRGTPVLGPGVHPRVTWPYGFNPSKDAPLPPPFPMAGSQDNRWRYLHCDLNTPRDQWTFDPNGSRIKASIKVWAVGTRLDNQVLLYVWSPCKLTGQVTISVPDFGDVKVNAPQPSGYWIVKKPLTGGIVVKPFNGEEDMFQVKTTVSWTPSISGSVVLQKIALTHVDSGEVQHIELDPSSNSFVFMLPLVTNYHLEIVASDGTLESDPLIADFATPDAPIVTPVAPEAPTGINVMFEVVEI